MNKFLDYNGLAYFWGKLKAYFAPKAHTHNTFEAKHSYTTAANAAKNWYRVANANTQQLDISKPIRAQFIVTAYNTSYAADYYETWFVNAIVFGRQAHIIIFGNSSVPFSQARILYENTVANIDANDRPAIDLYLNYVLPNGTTKIEIEEIYNNGGWTFLADGQLAASSVPSGFESVAGSIRNNGVERSTYADYVSYLNRQISNFTAAFTLADSYLYRSRTLNCTGTFTITIPSINSGYMWCVIKNKNTSSGVITLHPSTTSVLIDGSNADITLQPMEYVCIHSAGANNYSLIADGRWKSQKADKATTLAGYGITDAKIASGTITLGSSTITPLTSGSTLDAAKLSGTASIATTGNAGSATKLATSRTISLTGDVSGSASFDGSANASITATVADDSHNHVISNVDGLQTALDGKAADSGVVHKTGSEAIGGTKTFSNTIVGSVSGTATDIANGGDTTDLASARGLFAVRDNAFGTDLNSYTKSGFYYLSGTLSNQPKQSISNGFLFVMAGSGVGSSNQAKQFFSRYGTSDTNDHETYFRTRRYDGTWSSWHKVITQSGNGSFGFDGVAYPYPSNTHTLGAAGYLWKEIFCANATINTSDERLKQDISNIPDEVLDAWGEIDFKQFKFKDAVESKGGSARLHSGLVAQRIAEIFNAHGLDASAYGLYCYDKWDAKETEDGIEPAGDLYSLRYEEALCMEAAWQRRRADKLEARIAALEERLNAMA